MKAVTKRIIIILIICLIILAVSNNQVIAKNSRDDTIVGNAEDIDNSLKCKNPNYAHFIAHSQIDFSPHLIITGVHFHLGIATPTFT